MFNKSTTNYPVEKGTLKEFQELKRKTGKSIVFLLNRALRFALENRRFWEQEQK